VGGYVWKGGGRACRVCKKARNAARYDKLGERYEVTVESAMGE
jgi:hypothetical protein